MDVIHILFAPIIRKNSYLSESMLNFKSNDMTSFSKILLQSTIYFFLIISGLVKWGLGANLDRSAIFCMTVAYVGTIQKRPETGCAPFVSGHFLPPVGLDLTFFNKTW